MQFKTLALAAVAFAATSVSAFDNNACTACVFKSFNTDSVCKDLPANNLTAIQTAFGNGTVYPAILSGLIQNPSIKACLCHWGATAFTPTGAATVSCATGAAAACNATQVADAITQMTPIAGGLGCAASSNSSSSGSASPPASTGTSASTPAPTGNSGVQMNIPYVVSIAAIGLAAFAGF